MAGPWAARGRRVHLVANGSQLTCGEWPAERETHTHTTLALQPVPHSLVLATILTQMMADEFNFLWSKFRITLQRQMQI